MFRRTLAMLLALLTALMMTGCAAPASKEDGERSTPAVVEKPYSSDQAMDVFDAIDAVRDAEDFTFTYQVNEADAESGEAAENRLVVEGEWYKSTRQARAALTINGGKPLTTVVVDGPMCYVDVVTAAQSLSEAFGELENGEDSDFFQQELSELAEKFSTSYISIKLREDPWETLSGGDFQNVKTLLEDVYDSIRGDTAAKVRTDKSTCTLALGLGDLQTQLLKLTGSLTEKKTVYQTFLSDYINDNFAELLAASGWSMVDLMDTMWTKYEEMHADLTQHAAEGTWNDWTMKLVTCGDETDGYTLDFTDQRDQAWNYCLNITPAQPKEIAAPEESTDYTRQAEDVFTVYMDALIFRNYTTGTLEEDDFTDVYDEEYETFDEGDEVVRDDVETSPAEGYRRIQLTQMTTEDGKPITVPIFTDYDGLEAEEIDGNVYDLYQYTGGYQLEYLTIDTSGRELAQIAEENAQVYESIFHDDYEYEITQPATKAVLSPDGSAVVAGMAYYDSDEQCEVTVITGNLKVKDSEFVLGFDLMVYGSKASKKEVEAAGDFLEYLGLEAPLTIERR